MSRLAFLFAGLSLLACGTNLGACHPTPEEPDTHPASAPLPVKTKGEDDHTYPAIPNREAFFALSFEGTGGARAVKFLIQPFYGKEAQVLFLDSAFYRFHDEWFWFRLLNGQPTRGQESLPASAPTTGLRFTSIKDIYDWARHQETLPFGLAWLEEEGRLYSEHFYRKSIDHPRIFGLGTLFYIPPKTSPTPRPEYWLFDLEYGDIPSHEDIKLFFSHLEKTLPPEISQKLRWVTRSPKQEALAQAMREKHLPYFDRTMRYEDLVIPGETEVYSAGVTAGSLRILKEGNAALQRAEPYEILILKDIPDSLPPVAGLITAVPQTPLAHINILARNRGIPNVYRGGILDDPQINQSAGNSWVALRAAPPDSLEIVPIPNEEFHLWWELSQKKRLSARPANLKGAPDTLRLSDLSLKDVEELRPLIGGKAAGFLGLMAPGTVTIPDHPLVITVKPYTEHIASFLPAIEAMLLDNTFFTEARARYLVLEGPKKFIEKYPADQGFYEEFLKNHPEGDPVGDLVRQGGLVKAIRNKPIAPKTLASLTRALREQFGHYHPAQGLRFRSSSTIEDIEGFNGAGLYDSNTGYLDTTTSEGEKKKRSIEEALTRTWSSYWSFEAFEERHLENVDHLSGNMAVLVHANFQDELELANGVFTLTLFPEGFPEVAVMELNVQRGAQSVTNPEPGSGALPEVNRVILRAGKDSWEVERIRPSTLAEPGKVLLGDETLGEIFLQGKAVAEAWLAEQNKGLSPAQARRTLTLDFEFRQVAEGWPRLSSGSLPPRVVLKQARSLEPGLERVPETLRALPIPRDILARASRIVRRTFFTKTFTLTTLEVFCDPFLPPDLGCRETPFLAEVTLTFSQDIPALGVTAKDRLTLAHTAFQEVSYTKTEPTGFSLRRTPKAQGADIDGITITEDGRCLLSLGEFLHEEKFSQEPQGSVLFSTPEEFLLGLFPDAKR